MQWRDWEPTARAIRAEFGYPEAADLEAARNLQRLVPPTARWRTVGTLLRNRDLFIVGCGPSLERLDARHLVGHPVVACDGATQRLLELGVVPDVAVTDLDGQASALKAAAAAGTTMVVHAHGDNRQAIADLVPSLGPQLHGTHQVEPRPELEPLANFGGFTDGDRAVLMCEELGVRRASLAGFDFTATPSRYSHRWDPTTKPAKLAWAQRIVAQCHARGRIAIRMWRP